MWIYHIMGRCQNEYYHKVKEFEERLNPINFSELHDNKNGFTDYSIVFYFKDESEEIVRKKINEEFGAIELFLIAHKSSFIKMD